MEFGWGAEPEYGKHVTHISYEIQKVLLFICCTCFCSCSDDDETEGDFPPTVFNVMGKVEKGPMIRGSHVNMRTLDEYMTPTGSFYSATIGQQHG